MTARYESWEATSWQPRRPLESLVLTDRALEDLLDDLRTFYGSRSWYVQRGIPYRRGYLLHGPPGNGKTTLVLAAAGELNLSVAVLSLSNRLLSDKALRGLVDALPPATLLLIEDVDCVFKTERMTTEQTGVTLSGLLNALDGVSSREGRVLFLTTNHPERLDPALVRPGRTLIARSSSGTRRPIRPAGCSSGFTRVAECRRVSLSRWLNGSPRKFPVARRAWRPFKSTCFAIAMPQPPLRTKLSSTSRPHPRLRSRSVKNRRPQSGRKMIGAERGRIGCPPAVRSRLPTPWRFQWRNARTRLTRLAPRR